MNLKFAVGTTVSCGYCSSKEVLRTIEGRYMISGFMHRMRSLGEDNKYRGNQAELIEEMNKMRGGISPKIRLGRIIAMMDVDHQDFKNQIVEELVCRGIAHTVVESSDSHYWIIADKFKANRWRMADYLDDYLVIDPKYLEYSRGVGFNLRSYPRNGQTPQIIQRYGTGSRDYRAFIKAWEDYWAMPHIEWMNQEFLMNAV